MKLLATLSSPEFGSRRSGRFLKYYQRAQKHGFLDSQHVMCFENSDRKPIAIVVSDSCTGFLSYYGNGIVHSNVLKGLTLFGTLGKSKKRYMVYRKLNDVSIEAVLLKQIAIGVFIPVTPALRIDLSDSDFQSLTEATFDSI